MRAIRSWLIGLVVVLVLASGACTSPPEPEYSLHGDCLNTAGEIVSCGASDAVTP